MLRRLRGEEGWALATVMGLMAITLGMAIATMGVVDTQQRESGVMRTKETAFNVAEAALNAQIFALAQEWPGQGDAATPYGTCTPSSTGARCPSSSTLTALSSSPDANGLSWRTSVRDNGTATTQSFYSDSATETAPGFDANGDGKLWVRSEATANGRKRTLIAQVRVEEAQEDLPTAAVIAGRVAISNSGNKPIVDGTNGAAPTMSVRCEPQVGESQACLGHQVTGSGQFRDVNDLYAFLDRQVEPNVTATSYTGGSAISADGRARLKATAQADGTYYATCPTTPPAGRVVWIESGTCTWTSNSVVNSPANPGLLVLNHATAYIGGTVEFYGIVYGVNPADSSGAIVQVQGNAQVSGGVLIDGQGLLIAGSSKLNIKLDTYAHQRVRSYVSAGMIQNTWREIPSR